MWILKYSDRPNKHGQPTQEAGKFVSKSGEGGGYFYPVDRLSDAKIFESKRILKVYLDQNPEMEVYELQMIHTKVNRDYFN